MNQSPKNRMKAATVRETQMSDPTGKASLNGDIQTEIRSKKGIGTLQAKWTDLSTHKG